MEISEAVRDDIPEMCDLLGVLFAQEVEFRPDRSLQAAGLRQIIDRPDLGRILVARQGAAVIGMVNLLFTISTALGGPVVLLEDMVVRPEYRGSGIGSTLLRAANDLARSCGCGRITLLTDRTNEAAQRFYERHGFRRSEMIAMRLPLEA